MLTGPSLGPASGGKPRQIVILIHGYGSNGADLLSLAPYWYQHLPNALFVAPNAPEPCPGLPGGFQWWALETFDRAALAAGVARAAPKLDAFVDAQLAAHGLTERDLVLIGFSQGTMMALHVGPLRARRIAGIIGYSGVLADPHTAGVRTKPPVLLVHGDADPVVPIAGFHRSVAELQAMRFDLETHVSIGLGHGVDAQGLDLGLKFIRRVLGIEI